MDVEGLAREEAFYLSSEKLRKCWEESFRGNGYDEEQVSILASFYSLNYIGIMPMAPNIMEAGGTPRNLTGSWTGCCS